MSAETTQTPRARAVRVAPEHRRPEILDAAFLVFQRHGYFRASMDAIAAEAGVSKPVVYGCFDTKDELFVALLEREERRVLGEIAAALPRTPVADPRAALADGLTGFLRAVADKPEAYRLVLLGDRGVPEGVAARIRHGRQMQVDAITALVEAWTTIRGLRADPDATRLLAYALVGATEGAARAVLTEPDRFDPDRTAHLLAGLMTRGEHALESTDTTDREHDHS
ncbi:TetR/AcrR family transcriptional regulator [Paraconexibacter sp.]|uniref:TetR/AcrR family transcriptional regulator n=1 Tax=Paraconexibacter sp. TaxID=2949640 RepID=UPI0035623832